MLIINATFVMSNNFLLFNKYAKALYLSVKFDQNKFTNICDQIAILRKIFNSDKQFLILIKKITKISTFNKFIKILNSKIKLENELENFLKIIFLNHRINSVDKILDRFVSYSSEKERNIILKIITNKTIDDDSISKIKKLIAKKIDKNSKFDLKIENYIKKQTLGGVIFEANYKIIDFSNNKKFTLIKKFAYNYFNDKIMHEINSDSA